MHDSYQAVQTKKVYFFYYISFGQNVNKKSLSTVNDLLQQKKLHQKHVSYSTRFCIGVTGIALAGLLIGVDGCSVDIGGTGGQGGELAGFDKPVAGDGGGIDGGGGGSDGGGGDGNGGDGGGDGGGG